MKIPFVGPSAQARSLNANAERTVNGFLEFDQSNPPRPVALYGTPGTILRETLTVAPVRAALQYGTYTYWIGGNTVFRTDAAFGVISFGSIGTSSGPVGMAVNANGQVLIVDGTGGWYASGITLTHIVDVDFPTGVTSACYLDGYFIVSGDGTRKLYWNLNPDDAVVWDGTDFASAESSPEAVLGCVVDHRSIFVFKKNLIEVWGNTGNSAQLFARSGDTVMEHGTAAFGTVQAMNNTLYWLGASKSGQGIVFAAQGFNPVEASHSPLETAMAGYSTIADAFGFCFELSGHAFYALTFPTADATWLYDAKTQQWTEWLWRDPATNLLHRHRASCCVFSNGEHLVGDYQTGDVCALSMTTYTDNGNPILRLRRTQTTTADGARAFFGELIVDMETGVGLATGQGSAPLLMLRYSNDGGHSWSGIKTKSIGAVGEYGRQAKFGPSGAGRNRTWEIAMTDPVKWAVFGANVEVTKGTA